MTTATSQELASQRWGRHRRGKLSTAGWIGIAFTLLVVIVGLFGPYFAPYAPDEILGAAYEPRSDDYVLGLDFLGRDVLSRFLVGGRTAILLALLATTISYAVGLLIGLTAAFFRGRTDTLMMRAVDVLLAFPALIMVLLLVAAFGTDLKMVILAVSIAMAPRIARIVRAAALEVVTAGYVEAARARGERALFVTMREILPNITAPILVDFGIRLTNSIVVIASVSFLGFGLQPPAADWGLMVSENRGGLTIQPWTVVGPVAAISLLTIGINMVIDGYRGAGGRPDEAARHA